MSRRRPAGAGTATVESDGGESEEEEDEDEEDHGLGFELRGRGSTSSGGGPAGVRARWEASSGGGGLGGMEGSSGLGLVGLGGGGGSSFARSRFGGGGGVRDRERSADERDVNVLSTDGEEPLPTSLLRPPPTPPSRLAVLASTPLVLLLLRLLSVVPSVTGTFYLVGRVLGNSSSSSSSTFEEGSRMECFLACFWSLLTATQCFLLTSGLTRRWLAYYSLPSTLLRLLSLQTICWPATSITLRLLGPSRPLVAWIVVGTTTTVSNSIRLWVTSNIPAGSMVSGGTGVGGLVRGDGGGSGKSGSVVGGAAGGGTVGAGGGGGKIGGRRGNKRRMDWGLVVRQCVWPCLVGYMLTSWCLLVERDYSRRDLGTAGGFGE
ncbi:N-glycosylation protein-domain-containing protein [Mrakia frigida]|uniref:N-glycosylation protein-domain-containing protein n=1 Tax=Mrakia frigida TaxID=29902 RepID=UPI003FCC1BD1